MSLMFDANKSEYYIKHIKNNISFLVCLYCTRGIFLRSDLNNECLVVLLYSIFDSAFVSRDYIIHHICAGALALYKLKYGMNYEVAQTILSTEISTIFLVLNNYINVIFPPHTTPAWVNTVKSCNGIIFLVLFFYLRMVKFYIMFNYNKDIYIVPAEFLQKCCYYISFAALYGLFVLNLYWFIIICKKIYKQLGMHLRDTYYNAEYILQYSYGINLITALYYYTDGYTVFPPKKWYMYIDLFGICLLTNNSYYYHNALFKNLALQYDFNIIDDENVNYFMNDIFSIHVRSFLCAFVTLYSQCNVAAVYYITIPVLIISFLLHVLSINFFQTYIFAEWRRYGTITYIDLNEYNGRSPSRNVMLTIKIPLMFDIISTTLIAASFTGGGARFCIDSFTLMFLMICTVTIKPFYKYNHLFLHYLLHLQSDLFASFISGARNLI